MGVGVGSSVGSSVGVGVGSSVGSSVGVGAGAGSSVGVGVGNSVGVGVGAPCPLSRALSAVATWLLVISSNTSLLPTLFAGAAPVAWSSRS